MAGGKLDGLVTCAGVSVPFNPKLMLSINWFGTMELLDGLKDALAKGNENSYVVAVSSNSTTITPNIPDELVNSCLARDEPTAYELLDALDSPLDMAISYAASKLAVARYVRVNFTIRRLGRKWNSFKRYLSRSNHDPVAQKQYKRSYIWACC
ncbi:MAG: hypothetical protein Ct9H90mP30_0770 [Actinomycetota bacterium]|nr:MAG: hypothetical protein Ct9H90mP30_0770 [Actinomycetota bacterium]